MAKKVLGLAVAGVIGLSAGIGGSAMLMPEPDPIVNETVKEVEVIKEVPVNNTIVEEVEVIKEVDNGNLDMVLDKLHEEDGEFSYITEGLMEDEVDQIVDRIVQVSDFELTAENRIRSSFSIQLERDSDTNFEARDVDRLVIDSDETKVVDVDFDEDTATVESEVEFKYEGKIYSADVSVEIFKGVAQPLELSNIQEE